MRPADRIVVVGFRPAEEVDLRRQELGRLDVAPYRSAMAISLKQPLGVPSADAPLSPMM